MNVKITDGGVDGLNVRFEHDFYFDTWDEAFKFIKKVDELFKSKTGVKP